jgi:hypothetical protein
MTERGWMHLTALVVLLGACGNCLRARPITPHDAGRLVTGWLRQDPAPLGMFLGRQVKTVATVTGNDGAAVGYLVFLSAGGFVIVPADDRAEPIVGFGAGGHFDPSQANPLAALVTRDLMGRMAAVRARSGLPLAAPEPSETAARTKWRHLTDRADAPEAPAVITALAVGTVSDLRVAPLVKSKWHQMAVCGQPCYNYYVPGNCPCGCTATALAQLIRYYEYPTQGIGVHEFAITLCWITCVTQERVTRGGDGAGGPYDWSLMPYEPDCDTTHEQRQAIGSLCYDAGLAMNQVYNSTSSGWEGGSNAPMVRALTNTFLYAYAVHGYNGEASLGGSLLLMINPNLDARKPVILGTVEHAFLCDGYGYDNSTLYHHLNLGWSGESDMWYDLNVRIGTEFDLGPVCSCVYNVETAPAGDGEIVSGRVLDQAGQPLARVTLYAQAEQQSVKKAQTDSNGIYAFDGLCANTVYTVTAVQPEYEFLSQQVATGLSLPDTTVTGNVWGLDFIGRSITASNE